MIKLLSFIFLVGCGDQNPVNKSNKLFSESSLSSQVSNKNPSSIDTNDLKHLNYLELLLETSGIKFTVIENNNSLSVLVNTIFPMPEPIETASEAINKERLQKINEFIVESLIVMQDYNITQEIADLLPLSLGHKIYIKYKKALEIKDKLNSRLN